MTSLEDGHSMSRPRRNSHAGVGDLVSALAVALVLQRSVNAAPRGAVEVPEDGYLYALDAEELTDATDGLTIEMWLTDPPGDDVVWPLVAKEGSYTIGLNGRDLNRPNGVARPEGSMHLWFIRTDGGGGGATAIPFGPAERFWILSSWVHIALQVQGVKGSGKDSLWFNGEQAGGGGVRVYLNPRG